MPSWSSRLTATAIIAVCLLANRSVRADEPLVQVEDAFILQTDDGPGWSIGNQLIRFSLGLEGQSMVLRGIQDAETGFDWLRSSDADSSITVNGQKYAIGSAATPFTGASAVEYQGGVRLSVGFRIPGVPIEVMRSYVCYPGSSVIETWTTFRNDSTVSATFADLNDYELAVDNGTMRWISGLGAPDEGGGAFTNAEGDLDDGQAFEIGSDRRASEQQVPWFGVRKDEGTFFGAILWSGSWKFRATRHGDAIVLRLGLPPFSTAVASSGTLETPHAIFGLTNQSVPAVSMALRRFIDTGLRQGRRFGSYVTYNTWYSYGTFIDEPTVLAEMEQAAAMGVEQFVVDAGWWAGINGGDPNDFSRGWGTWEVDAGRFPSGLAALTVRAHELGLRFGVWVEPESVDRATVGAPGLAKERFLARRDGRYNPERDNAQQLSAQICLADPEARQWVLDMVSRFIEAVQPDYLKWDNNYWVNCNRSTHSHGREDGNFAHNQGLHSVLGELRARYPALDIENSASGGNRISLDMLAFTDAGWMDDRTSVSARVRHNVEGLSTLFPAPYLFSMATSAAEEPIVDDERVDLPAFVRSRMLGMPGLSALSNDMSEGTRAALRRHFGFYRLLRPILEEGSVLLLTPQRVDFPDQPWSGWEVSEHLVKRTGDALIFAFDSTEGSDRLTVMPRALRPGATYDVESADFGAMGSATGDELMRSGVQLQSNAISRAHILILRVHDGQ